MKSSWLLAIGAGILGIFLITRKSEAETPVPPGPPPVDHVQTGTKLTYYDGSWKVYAPAAAEAAIQASLSNPSNPLVKTDPVYDNNPPVGTSGTRLLV